MNLRIETNEPSAPSDVRQICGIYRRQRKSNKHGPVFLNKRSQLYLYQTGSPVQWVVASRLNSIAFRARAQQSGSSLGVAMKWKLFPSSRTSGGSTATWTEVPLILTEVDSSAVDSSGPADAVVIHGRWANIAGLYRRQGEEEPPAYANAEDGTHLFIINDGTSSQWYISNERPSEGSFSFLVRSAPVDGPGEAASPEDADWSEAGLTLLRVAQVSKILAQKTIF